MKPSDIAILDPIPLGYTFEHVEAEMMGTIMVCALQLEKDEWGPVTKEMLSDFVDSVREDIPSWMKNPFLKPDADDLVERGFAEWVDPPGTIEFTEKGMEALRNSRWNKAKS